MSSSNAYSGYFWLDFPCNTCVPNISVTDLCLKENDSFVWDIQCMSPHVSTLNIFCDGAHLWRNWWRYIASVVCIPNSYCQARRKNGINTSLALIVVLLRVSVDHLGSVHDPREARAEGDQRVKRADCCQARLPRLCWSDLILLCWRICSDIFSTGGCNGCLNLDNPSNFGLEDLVDELETLYEDEGYSSLISRFSELLAVQDS